MILVCNPLLTVYSRVLTSYLTTADMTGLLDQDRLKLLLSRFLPIQSTEKLTSGTNNPRFILTADGFPVRRDEHMPPSRPQPVATKHGSGVVISETAHSHPPTSIKLDTIESCENMNERCDVESNHGSGTASPTQQQARSIATTPPSVKYPYMNRWRVPATCIAFFIQGMNDSVPGALLPYMERYYGISHAIMSLIFVANACGFIAAGPLCHLLNNRFGRAKVLSACTILNTLAYIALVCQPPFPVVIIAFLLLGFGFATILALDNVFLVNLQGGTALLGYMHGMYGVGGTVAPFIATAMVSNDIRWSYFYTISVALSVINTFAFFITFREYETETASAQLMTALERSASRATTEEKKDVLKKALKNRTTLLGALLIFSYQAAEVAISGWVISFLIDYRNGDPKQVGYVTSGFWGGITLGRFILVKPCHKLGDRISLVVLIAGTAAFQFMVWFLPNVIGNAVAVAIIGLLLGPTYPCATGVFSRLLPAHLQITSLGLIGSVGSSGGAVGPLLTGALAQKLGTVVLNPICIVLCVVMEVAWLGLPKEVKRSE